MIEEPRMHGSDACKVWFDEVEAVCLTLVGGMELDEVAAVLSAGPEPQWMAGFDEALLEQSQRDGGVYQLDTLGSWSVVVEPGGSLCAHPEVVEALSAQGRVVSAYTSVRGEMRFQAGFHGEIVRSFDPLMPELGEGFSLPQERGLPLGEPGLAWAAACTLVERCTGVDLTESWLLERERLTLLTTPAGPRALARLVGAGA